MKYIIILISIIILNYDINAQNNQDIDSNTVFTLVERMPNFISGNNKIGAYVTNNFDFSKTYKIEKCFYKIIVDKTGSVSEIVKLKGDNNNEMQLTEIFKKPEFKWTVATQNGRKVNVYVLLTVTINKNLIDVGTNTPQIHSK